MVPGIGPQRDSYPHHLRGTVTETQRASADPPRHERTTFRAS